MVAFIYLSGGKVLRVSATREEVTADLQRAGADQTLVYEVGFPSAGVAEPGEVTIVAGNIAAVSDRPLPNPLS